MKLIKIMTLFLLVFLAGCSGINVVSTHKDMKLHFEAYDACAEMIEVFFITDENTYSFSCVESAYYLVEYDDIYYTPTRAFELEIAPIEDLEALFDGFIYVDPISDYYMTDYEVIETDIEASNPVYQGTLNGYRFYSVTNAMTLCDAVVTIEIDGFEFSGSGCEQTMFALGFIAVKNEMVYDVEDALVDGVNAIEFYSLIYKD